MSRVLCITGCNGSVGKAVVRAALLSKDYDRVIGVDLQDSQTHAVSERFTYTKADLRSYEDAIQAVRGSTAVIHLAGIPGPTDYLVDTHNTNVVVNWNVLRACTELSIWHIAQASSVNVLRGVYSQTPQLHYLPIDELHPCEPDEPYGISKLIAETQATGLCRRYSKLRIASIRPHWSIESVQTILNHPNTKLQEKSSRAADLWGWVHEDSLADAFLRAVSENAAHFQGHETFFIAAPTTIIVEETSDILVKEYHKDVELRASFKGKTGFYDCSKAEKILGWVHRGH